MTSPSSFLRTRTNSSQTVDNVVRIGDEYQPIAAYAEQLAAMWRASHLSAGACPQSAIPAAMQAMVCGRHTRICPFCNRLAAQHYADAFLGESENALAYCLQHFNATPPAATAATIVRVGHWLDRIPR